MTQVASATPDGFDDLRDLYQEVILDHGRRPRNATRLDDFTTTANDADGVAHAIDAIILPRAVH